MSAHGKTWRDNFAPLQKPLRPEEARLESSRCLYCYDAPCIKVCPTHIDIPRFIRQIAAADPLGSAETILEANALGHSCARVCPVEVLCEGDCVYHDWHEKPIQIARLQRFATDALHASGERPFSPGPDNGKRVAIIGAGPAGVSCATYLRRLGFAVSIFEKRDLPGGLNTFGVAEYKLDQKTSLAELKWLFTMGCDVVKGKEVGRDVPVEDLFEDFDAVFLGIGLGSTHSLGVPGESLPGVYDALTFIERVKAGGKGIAPSARTVVIGGGNTAIDATTQSKRSGAAEVTLAYRRGREDMSAYDFEVALARADGASLLTNAMPTRILGKTRVEGVEFVKSRLVRGKLAAVPRSKFVVACDRVIKAIGQGKHFALAKALKLQQKDDGRLICDPRTLQTSQPRVFAGGDAVNGGKEVVNAAADGKRAARGIWTVLFPGAPLPEGNDYWASTIDGRVVAPITPRDGSRP